MKTQPSPVISRGEIGPQICQGLLEDPLSERESSNELGEFAML